jgi:hypothetical protein
MAAERAARRLTWGLLFTLLAIVLLAGAGWVWIAQDRAARRAETERAVEEALKEAQRLLGEADWAGARAVAERANALVDQEEASESLRRRVHDLLIDLDMVQRLEHNRLRAALTNRDQPD